MKEAVVLVGGKQYIVNEGDVLDIEKIENSPGEKITLDKVLLVATDKEILIGKPFLKNVSVKAEVLEHLKAKKVIHFKYTPKKNSKRKKGHRQPLTRIKVLNINI